VGWGVSNIVSKVDKNANFLTDTGEMCI